MWNNLSIQDKASYIREAVANGIYNRRDIISNYNSFAKGGYKPSDKVKKDIATWEGSSMKTNRSFEAEANDFNKYLSKGALNKLTQSQLDALYS